MKSLPTIQKGVPRPQPEPERVRVIDFLREFEIGDSAFFEGETRRSLAISVRQKRLGYNFTSRLVTEGGVRGVRLWRVA